MTIWWPVLKCCLAWVVRSSVAGQRWRLPVEVLRLSRLASLAKRWVVKLARTAVGGGESWNYQPPGRADELYWREG